MKLAKKLLNTKEDWYAFAHQHRRQFHPLFDGKESGPQSFPLFILYDEDTPEDSVMEWEMVHLSEFVHDGKGTWSA